MSHPGNTTTVPKSLEKQLDQIFAETPNLSFEKVFEEARDSVEYVLNTRPELDLRLSFELLSDTLFVYFDSCHLMAELAAHRPKFRKNPNAFADWSSHCVHLVRSIVSSRQLKIVHRSTGDEIGGRLYRHEGDKWICCGGELFMCFSKKSVAVYSDWY